MRHWPLITLVWALSVSVVVQGAPETPAEARHPFAVDLPAVQLRNQDGADVRLPDELGRHDIVLINFLFTCCPTICPTMGANFAQLSKALETADARGTALFSITLDPAMDTPGELKKWAAQFKPGKGWSLLTGATADINKVLKACGAYVSDKAAHAPFVLIGSPARKQWLRLEGNPSTDEVLRSIAALRGPVAPAADATPAAGAVTAETYFTDVLLTNQDGKKVRLYTDLLKDRVVVMNAFFASCSGACSMTMPRLKELQVKLAEANLGQRVHLLSFTVDPEADTTQVLKNYAESMGAKPGWDFLTGDKEAMDTALKLLGFKKETAEAKEAHGSLFIVGNVSTARLRKPVGFPSLAQLEALVQQILLEEK
jgi:cytochrome oxidase Cu insertion factor (SCO1/SenC/PrrC family)